MTKMCEVMQEFELMTVEDLGEDQTRFVVKDKDFLFKFVEFYNNILFSEKAKKTAINEYQLKTLKIINHYGKDVEPDTRGFSKVNISEATETCEKDLGLKMDISDVKDLCSMGILSDHLSEGGSDFAVFDAQDVSRLTLFWSLIHRLKSFQTD